MLFIPSLSSSYFASDQQVEDMENNLVGIVRDVEMVERELHSVVATLSDLASKLSQLKVKTKELAAGCSIQSQVGNASLQPSTSRQSERESKPALEAASRLVGEVDLDRSRVERSHLSSSCQVRSALSLWRIISCKPTSLNIRSESKNIKEHQNRWTAQLGSRGARTLCAFFKN